MANPGNRGRRSQIVGEDDDDIRRSRRVGGSGGAARTPQTASNGEGEVFHASVISNLIVILSAARIQRASAAPSIAKTRGWRVTYWLSRPAPPMPG